MTLNPFVQESFSPTVLRRKITIFISNESYLRNWIGAGAFKDLEDIHDVTYLIPEYNWNPDDVTKFTNANYVSIKQSKWRMKIFRYFLLIGMMSASKRSAAFRIKLSYCTTFRAKYFLPLFKIDALFKLFSNSFVAFMPYWKELEFYIKVSSPDLFIAPSLLADSFTMDLTHSARKHEIKTMILVNSWDNLVSKGTIPIQPTSLVVWGVNSINHARYVQRFESSRISVLGVPRFDSYFTEIRLNKSRPSIKNHICDMNGIPRSKKIILYPATSLPFDDIRALSLIDKEISTNSLLSDYVVLFRPHPETFPRKNEKFFFDQDFHNVFMDNQMISYYCNRFGLNSGQHVPSAINSTDLSYYPKLLQSIDIVVCPATTMLLETLIFGKPAVMICYNDNINTWLPPSEVAQYENIKELIDLPGVFMCSNESMLINLLLQSVEMSALPDSSKLISNATAPIVYNDDTTYSLRLLNLVNTTISSSGKEAPSNSF